MSELICPFCEGPVDPGPGGPCYGCLERFLEYEEQRRFIGDHEVLGAIGEGGTAIVYLGRHRVSGELVAIKHAKPALLSVPSGAELFLRQARIEASLRHANLVKVYATGEHEGRP